MKGLSENENLKYSFKETPCFRAYLDKQKTKNNKKSISPKKRSNKKKSTNQIDFNGYNLSFGETFSSANQRAINERSPNLAPYR